MKKSNEVLLFVALLGAAFVLPSLHAEDAPPPPPPPADHPEHGPGRRGPGQMWERAAKELSLTADQEAKWKEIGQQERTALEAIRNDESIPKEEKRAKAMEAMKPFADQRRAILTPDQQAKFDELRAKMRERGPGGPPKPKAE